MWFKIKFYADSHPIATVVAVQDPETQVYFKATDVGKFLGYVSTYNFAQRYARRDFNLTLPENIRPAKKCLVFTFEEMATVIHHLKHKHDTPVCVQDMIHLWLEGRVDNKIPDHPVWSFKYAPQLHVRRGTGEHGIQDWIRAYKNVVASYFYSRDYHHCYEAPPSVATVEQEDVVFDAVDIEDSRPIVCDRPEVNLIDTNLDEPVNLTDTNLDEPVNLTDMNLDEPVNLTDMNLAGPELTDMNLARPERDPRIAARNRRKNERPMRRQMIPESIGSPEPENICDLRMDFDAFPPDRIYIRVHGMLYEYTKQMP